MSSGQGIEVSEWPKERRGTLEEVLEESFEGWYLYHAKWKLAEAEDVLVATEGGAPLGLCILEMLGHGAGYIFYIAVRKAARRRGIGSLLVDKSLDFFRLRGCDMVYASVEKDNTPSRRLFESKGFSRRNYAELTKHYGRLGALAMYSRMVIVPGEALLAKSL